MKKILVIFSGGLDSTTLLYKLMSDGHLVAAISFDYGQRHNKELEYAGRTCAQLDVEHTVVNLPGVFSGSALTGDVDVPLRDYSVETMKKTVVPNRNMTMISVAISYAISKNYDAVAYGAHAGDHEVYPDCRPAFFEAIRRVAGLCDWTPVEVLAPFIDMSKRDIAQLSRALGVDPDSTWSCYQGGEEPCGQCGACRSRQEALK